MTRKAKKYLWDIAHSIEQIEAHIAEIDDLDAYKKNLLVRDAVERRLTIIGEATY